MDRGILMENRIIGLPRLRQLKVHNSSCHIVSQFSGIIRKCFARYDPDKVKIYLGLFIRLISLITQEDRETFAPERQRYSSLDAWTYKTAEELGSSSLTHWGLVSSYSGNGFTQVLKENKTASQLMMAELKRNLWIRSAFYLQKYFNISIFIINSSGTRVVFIDFTGKVLGAWP